MIQIASATYRPETHVVNENVFKNFIKQLGGELSNLSIPCNCAFLGYSAWRQSDPDYPMLSDKQVFVVHDGRVFFLKPRHFIDEAYGVNWGDSGEGATQLAYAMLAEVLNGGFRSQRIAERFRDEFIARIPKNVNWTIDGAEVLAIALAIESGGRSPSNAAAALQPTTKLPAPGTIRQSSSSQVVRQPTAQHRVSNPHMAKAKNKKQVLDENEQKFLKALGTFKDAAIDLEEAWDALEDDQMLESPLLDEYPFHKCFKELTFDICKWVNEFAEWAKPA